MKFDPQCLPCLVNQVVRTAEMVGATDIQTLFQKTFALLSRADYQTLTMPELGGETFAELKQHIGNADPYLETRRYYNQLLYKRLPQFARHVNRAADPLELAIKYAIMGNVVDFSPLGGLSLDDVERYFDGIENRRLEIDDLQKMREDLQSARILLYLGDNCGELCMDKLLIQKLREAYPQLTVYFGVRGQPVLNDVTLLDASEVKMEDCATVVSNGDGSQGTALWRTSPEFQRIFQLADVVLAKGQGNYETLDQTDGKNRYFLLMAKCQVIARAIGVPRQSLVCMNMPAKCLKA